MKATVFLTGFFCLLACSMAGSGEFDAVGNDKRRSEAIMEIIEGLLDPFWSSDTMRGESLFFCERKAGEMPTGRLLFPPIGPVTLKSANGATVYEEGRDFALDRSDGTLRLLPGTRIPWKTLAEMYPPADSKLPKYGHKRGDPKTHLIFGEGHFFHDMQVEASYRHAAGIWQGYKPAFAGAALPRSVGKLKGKERFKLCLIGDSISAGANASRFTKSPPHMPAYGELVALGLERAYGATVEFRNFSVGGWCTEQGLTTVQKIAAERPDLVIVAFGMNDSGNKDAARYAANTRAIMDKLRSEVPEVEFVLVASMLPNPEWHYPRMENFPAFRDELARLCGKGAAMADMTSLWADLLKRKAWHDLTGNGVNHPNDFGHRLYAQVILGLLVEPDRFARAK